MCPLNPGIPDQYGPLEAQIYVDDILASAVGKQNVLRLLAAIIQAIFTVCGRPMIEVRQCPLSLKKWEELVVCSVQTVLGLTVNTNKLTVGITPEYRKQVRDILTEVWPGSRRIFKVADMQKLIGKNGTSWRRCPMDLQDHVAYLNISCLCFKAEQIVTTGMLDKIPRYYNQNREEAI